MISREALSNPGTKPLYGKMERFLQRIGHTPKEPSVTVTSFAERFKAGEEIPIQSFVPDFTMKVPDHPLLKGADYVGGNYVPDTFALSPGQRYQSHIENNTVTIRVDCGSATGTHLERRIEMGLDLKGKPFAVAEYGLAEEADWAADNPVIFTFTPPKAA